MFWILLNVIFLYVYKLYVLDLVGCYLFFRWSLLFIVQLKYVFDLNFIGFYLFSSITVFKVQPKSSWRSGCPR